MTDPTDNTRPDREALRRALTTAWAQTIGQPGVVRVEASVDAVLALLPAQPARPAIRVCPGNDPGCPCPDGLMCHYEGPDAWPLPAENLGSAQPAPHPQGGTETYPCCRHCAEDREHAVPPEGHGVPCDDCEDEL